jgi:enterochelin esterase family protein
LGASFAGFTHPEVFGNVLSMSGSYWWNPQDDLEPEWLTRQFARSPKRPVRLFVAIGLMEMKDRQLATNRHFRDILIAKGYSVEYREFNGAHSYLNWRGSLADGLLYLFGEKSF